ncbi:hypothetical protein ACQEVZ_55215 [Dactylosporangium sp. CA-152071]|uniref:hypothetical protein n=1 Tax=Dactylosporangium sp. CA-152071 TaxID=3239933 RepID=UPI003D92374F
MRTSQNDLRPPLLLLAGTSESGKSTAGAYLAARGVHRVKIRTILTCLTSGVPAVHEGVPMREGFDHSEFIDRLLTIDIPADRRAVLVESFIDTSLAEAARTAWPAPCRIVFITAPRAVRLQRLAADRHLDLADAASMLDAKDARKRVTEQLDRWRAIAEHWINNDTNRDDYLQQLASILDQLTRPEGTR